jgi:hypothetical protein
MMDEMRSLLMCKYLSNVQYFVFLSKPIFIFFHSTSKVICLLSCSVHFDLLYVCMNTSYIIYRF